MGYSLKYQKFLRVGKATCPSHHKRCSIISEYRHDVKTSKKSVIKKVRRSERFVIDLEMEL